MYIKPIRNKNDYELACKRIEEILQAEPGTPEDDELNCRRPLTLGDIRTLSRVMQIPTEILSQEYSLRNASSKDTSKRRGKSQVLNRQIELSGRGASIISEYPGYGQRAAAEPGARPTTLSKSWGKPLHMSLMNVKPDSLTFRGWTSSGCGTDLPTYFDINMDIV